MRIRIDTVIRPVISPLFSSIDCFVLYSLFVNRLVPDRGTVKSSNIEINQNISYFVTCSEISPIEWFRCVNIT